MGLTVSLTPRLEKLVRSKVSSGLYASPDEVLHEALRPLEDQGRAETAKLKRLRADIQAGVSSGPSAAWDAKAIRRKARSRSANRSVAA